jgi:hypothetical protein
MRMLTQTVITAGIRTFFDIPEVARAAITAYGPLGEYLA